MLKQIFIIGTMLASSLNMHGQVQKFTLKQCIDYAWLNNLDVKQSMLNSKSTEIDVLLRKGNFLPTLSASAGQNYQFGRTIDRFTNTYVNQTIRSNNMGLNAGIMLFSGFQNVNSLKQAQYTQKASDATIEFTKNQIALSISSSFLTVIQSIESVNNAQLQIASTQQRIERAQKQVDAGVADLTNLLSLKAQIANEQLNLVTAESNKNAAMISLRNTMQLPMEVDFDIVVPDISQVIINVTPQVLDIYETALKNMPQIRSAVEQNNAAKAQTNVAKGSLAPSISLYGNINTVYSQSAKNVTGYTQTGTAPIGYTQTTQEVVLQPIFSYQTETIGFNKQLKDNIGQGAGISFSWNLFNGFQVQSQIQKAKINQQISDINLQKQKNTLLNDINTAVNSYNSAKAKYDASKNNVEAQKTSLEYIQKRFDAGVSTSFDFINAKNSYLQAQSNELQARYEMVFRALILEYYKGNTIQL